MEEVSVGPIGGCRTLETFFTPTFPLYLSAAPKLALALISAAPWEALEFYQFLGPTAK